MIGSAIRQAGLFLVEAVIYKPIAAFVPGNALAQGLPRLGEVVLVLIHVLPSFPG